MSIFTKLDNTLFGLRKAWINAFNDDEELSANNNEKALRTSQAMTISHGAGMSMYGWTIGLVIVAPIVMLSLPATWPIWASTLIGLVAVGLTEAFLTLAISTYLNRNEIFARWQSEWHQSRGLAGKAAVVAGVAFNCVVTVAAAALWAVSAPFGKLGKVLSRLIPEDAHKPLQVLGAALAYATPGIVSLLRRPAKKRFKSPHKIAVDHQDTCESVTESDSSKTLDIKEYQISTEQQQRIFDSLSFVEDIASGNFLMVQSENEDKVQSIFITTDNLKAVNNYVHDKQNKKIAVVSPDKFFKMMDCRELRINRYPQFTEKFSDKGEYPILAKGTVLSKGDVVLFYPKVAAEAEGTHLDPTQCFFQHVNADNKKALEELADTQSGAFACRVIKAADTTNTTNTNGKTTLLNTQFTELLKDGTLAADPEFKSALFSVLMVPGATWMGIGLGLGALAGFFAGGPAGAIVGAAIGFTATWIVPALLTPLTGYTYYKTKGAKDTVSTLIKDSKEPAEYQAKQQQSSSMAVIHSKLGDGQSDVAHSAPEFPELTPEEPQTGEMKRSASSPAFFTTPTPVADESTPTATPAHKM